MFYSQIILAKKGPLGHLWMAAHFQDKKLNRAQIFATDISASVESIVHPAVPLALRVSGHLLLGVVRIYSKKVHYLWQDCHQAMVQIQMAFLPSSNALNPAAGAGAASHKDGGGNAKGRRGSDPLLLGIDMDPQGGAAGGGGANSKRRRRTKDSSGSHDKSGTADDDGIFLAAIPATTALQGFGIPFDLNDGTEDAEDWVPAEQLMWLENTSQQDNPEERSPEAAAAALGLPSGRKSRGDHSQEEQQASSLKGRRSRTSLPADRDVVLPQSLEDDFYSLDGSRGRRSSVGAVVPEEQWTAFDPDDGEELVATGKDDKRRQRPVDPDEEPEPSLPPPPQDEEEPPLPPMEDEDQDMMMMPPDFDEEEEENDPPPKQTAGVDHDQSSSTMQAVEIPRANESVASSEPTSARPSALVMQDPDGKTKADITGLSEREFSLSRDISGIPILDEEDDQPNSVARRSSSAANNTDWNLNQSSSGGGGGGAKDESSAAAVSLGDGGELLNPEETTAEEDEEERNPNPKKRHSSSQGNQDDTAQPKRKRRKVRANEGDIELSSARIRTMLGHTHDIMQPFVVPPTGHPDDDDGDQQESTYDGGCPSTRHLPLELQAVVPSYVSSPLMNSLTYEQLLDRAGMADGGGASLSLLQWWLQTAQLQYEVEGPPPETANNTDKGNQSASATKADPSRQEDENDDEDDDDEEHSRTKTDSNNNQSDSKELDDVEIARQGDQPEASGDVPPVDTTTDTDHHPMVPEQDDMDLPPPVQPEEDEEPPPFLDPEDQLPPPYEEEEEMEEDRAAAKEERKSSLSLGLVNTLGDEMEWDKNSDDDEEEDRQEAGDEIVSSNSKWHKHTVKVYSLLKSRMAPPGSSSNNNDGEENPKEAHLSYNGLSDGCSRRTAVGVFFELLQLKTWDFIELNQDEPYGDIVIAPGAKFSEAVPTYGSS